MKTISKAALAVVVAIGATVSAPAFADCSDAKLSAMMTQKNIWLTQATAEQILEAAAVMAQMPTGPDRDALCRVYGEVLDVLAPQIAETP